MAKYTNEATSDSTLVDVSVVTYPERVIDTEEEPLAQEIVEILAEAANEIEAILWANGYRISKDDFPEGPSECDTCGSTKPCCRLQ